MFLICFLSTKYMSLTKTVIMLNFIVSFSVHVHIHACVNTYSLSHTHIPTKTRGHQGGDLTWSCPCTWGDLWMCPYLCPWGKLWGPPTCVIGEHCGPCYGLPRWHRACLPVQELQEIRVPSLVRKIPWRRKWQLSLVFLVWRIPFTEEPGGLQSIGSQRVRYNWARMHNMWPLLYLCPWGTARP